jgi:hypothetical protein
MYSDELIDSEDGILIDLFLPMNQNALEGKLRFCKQHTNHVDPASHAALSSVILPPPALQAAIAELAEMRLIKQERRELWAHRVVQEVNTPAPTNTYQEPFHFLWCSNWRHQR